MIRFYFFLSCIVFQSSLTFCQSTLTIGEWKSHLSYKEGKAVTQNKEKIIYAAQRGIITIDKSDLSVDFLAKEDGLSDVTIAFLKYDQVNDLLIIVYSDSNIDILKDTDIYNIPFIKSNTNIIGSKKINDLYVSDDDIAYMATDFGIVGFNLKKLEFAFTTFTDTKITTVATMGTSIYIGTEKGLFYVDKVNNISDFNTWVSIPAPPDLTASEDPIDIATKFNTLYVAYPQGVYEMGSQNSFKKLISPNNTGENVTFLSDDGAFLMIGFEDPIPRSRVIFLSSDGSKKETTPNCISRVVDALQDETGRIWYADQWDPIKYTTTPDGPCQRLSFDVPYANTAGSIVFKGSDVYVASGGVTEDYQYANTNTGFYILSEGVWSNYNGNNVPEISADQIFNVQAIAPNPKSETIYIGSYWNGILEYEADTKNATIYNQYNSPLQGTVGDIARTRITSLVFDEDLNLWISNYGSTRPLVVKTNEDKWYSFSIPSNNSLADIAIDEQGNKWVAVVGAGNGLLVFNEGDNIADTKDDKSRYITRSNSEIVGNKVNCLAIDLDGSVWVGTSEGPVVFDCGDPFDASCKGNTRKVVVDDIPALLLKDEDILSIAIDGANRKWFGTRNGIFVQSPDGTTQIEKYDVKNSPLMDNKILELSYNPVSGEMFITSSSGIQSIKTETTLGGRSNASQVYAYPNPVRPEYSGPIAIKGLVRDANVKITDINGKLVYETKALGGQAIWDGNDYNGTRASTGVYLVFSVNENINQDAAALVTKILIIH